MPRRDEITIYWASKAAIDDRDQERTASGQNPLPKGSAQNAAAPHSPRLRPSTAPPKRFTSAVAASTSSTSKSRWTGVQWRSLRSDRPAHPASATFREPWFGKGGIWEVFSNAAGLGAKARVVIDAQTGAVLDKGYIRR
jgi:hypothetical protein